MGSKKPLAIITIMMVPLMTTSFAQHFGQLHEGCPQEIQARVEVSPRQLPFPLPLWTNGFPIPLPHQALPRSVLCS